jgi:hypothetical protein
VAAAAAGDGSLFRLAQTGASSHVFVVSARTFGRAIFGGAKKIEDIQEALGTTWEQ